MIHSVDMQWRQPRNEREGFIAADMRTHLHGCDVIASAWAGFLRGSRVGY